MTGRTPQRLRFNRFEGIPLPAGAKLITRGTRFGNPFKAEGRTPEANAVAVERYREWLREQPDKVAEIREQLAGSDVACACPGDWPCHGDVILRVAAGGAA